MCENLSSFLHAVSKRKTVSRFPCETLVSYIYICRWDKKLLIAATSKWNRIRSPVHGANSTGVAEDDLLQCPPCYHGELGIIDYGWFQG